MSMRQQREKNKMTQEALAEVMGISRSIVAMWETGRAMPTTDKLVKLAEIFHCTVDEVLKFLQHR